MDNHVEGDLKKRRVTALVTPAMSSLVHGHNAWPLHSRYATVHVQRAGVGPTHGR